MYLLFDSAEFPLQDCYVCNFNTFIDVFIHCLDIENIDQIVTQPKSNIKIQYGGHTVEISNNLISKTGREILQQYEIPDYALSFYFDDRNKNDFPMVRTSSYNIFHELDDLIRVFKSDIVFHAVSTIPFANFDFVTLPNVFGFLHMCRWTLLHLVKQKYEQQMKCVFPHPCPHEVFFHGGGPVAWACAGWISAILNVDPTKYTRFSGSSMGAIVATFCAFNDRSDLFSKCLEAYNHLEIIDFSNECLVHFAGLSIPDVHLTFEECHSKNEHFRACELNILATDLLTFECKVFSYSTTPNVKVIDALIASCAIPYVLGTATVDSVKYVDGVFSEQQYLRCREVQRVSIEPQKFTNMFTMFQELPDFVTSILEFFKIIEEQIDTSKDNNVIILKLKEQFNPSDDIITKRACIFQNFMNSYLSSS